MEQFDFGPASGQTIPQKADKVSDATDNMIAGLNSSGNLVSTPFTVSNGKLCITYQKEVEE